MYVCNLGMLFTCSVLLLATTSDGTLFKALDAAKSILFDSAESNKDSNCKPAVLLCRCGNTRKSVTVKVPQCTRFYRFKARCGPCDGMTTDKVCPIFQNCAECTSDGGGKCSKCPSNVFGEHCENQCTCQNGADCDIEGRCLCPQGYEGKFCEKKLGCDPPRHINQPLNAELRPPARPSTIIYSCPPEYELEGTAVSTCLPDKQWSTPTPECLRKCPLLSEPANGRLKYDGSRLVVGVTAEATCHRNYRLIGQSLLRCKSDGTWNGELPRCEELASCPDPGDILYARRTEPPSESRIGGHFLQDTVIRYSCEPGFQQLGAESIICTFDGTWSSYLPSCVKVPSVIPDCKTTGKEVVSDPGIPVRIFCPPECASAQVQIWGTSIYRVGSSVCAAAIHSGKLTNSGGLVAVINNGEYTNFAGSDINNILSLNYEGRDESFRFDKIEQHEDRSRTIGDCPEGLERLEEVCVYISNAPLSKSAAEATCTNLGLRLSLPKSNEDRLRVLNLLSSKGFNRVWASQVATPGGAGNAQCDSATVQNSQFAHGSTNCNSQLHYICIHNPSSSVLASCADPGPIENGVAKPVGKVQDSFYVGSSIEYSCQDLHYMKGESTIYCRGNGTWSDGKPTCVRVDTCEEPPTPFGGFVNFLPPLNTPMAQRSALTPPRLSGYRVGRLPYGLEARPPPQMLVPTATPGPESEIDLPPGRYRVGTRAMYECESRYYTLVGSRTRRCEGEGQWSGRPPTCIPICGRSDSSRSPFIVNGNASDIGQWPWQAGIARYIQDYNLWYLLCGGSLLTERWVVTAAHCVTYAGTTLPIDPDKFRIYLGKYHRNDSKDDEYVQVKTIRELHIHPDYEPQIYDADIALLLLDTPVQLNTRVQPVCLPTEQSSREHLAPGSKGVVTGWGMNENQTNAETLQQAVVPIVSSKECEKGYEESELPLTVTENMFCGGYKQGRVDACSGDSGGPIVFVDQTSKERKWVLEGIVSWGSPNGCGHANQYGGYTKVSKFLDWIHLFF